MRKYKLLVRWLFVLFISLSVILPFYFSSNLVKTNSIGDSIYVLNHNYIINNNIAQYSSYLLENNEGIQAEIFIQYQLKYKINYENINDYICLVKLVNLKKEETIEIKPSYSPRFYWEINKKLIFKFKRENFEIKFNLKDIHLAVIRVDDYDRNLEYNEFMDKIDLLNFTKPIVLPYFLINFQIPTILKIFEPRLESISYCVHYTYSISKENLKYWIDTHLSFDVKEILFYDATDGELLTSYLNTLNDERLSVLPYRIEFDNFCKYVTRNQYPKNLNNFLLKLCKMFHQYGFKEKVKWRAKHDQLTSNDCFTQMSQKYELVGYYDLDEFIYPRSFNSFDAINCSLNFCSLKPFQNSLHSYFKTIAYAYAGSKDPKKINSIYFPHAAFLTTDRIESKFVEDIRVIIKEISNDFPYKIFMKESESTTNKHTFLIEKNDIDYLKYIHESYNQLVSCGFRNLIKNNNLVEDKMLRYLYFITEPDHRLGKSVYFSKNIKTIFLHDVEESESNTWQLKIPTESGHYVSHFRETLNFFSGNFNSSIKNLKIDFQYLIYLIQKNINYCL